MSDLRKFTRLTPGVHPTQNTALDAQDVPHIALITKVTDAGAWFEIPATPGLSYGPAPWGLGSYADVTTAIAAGWKPLVGDRALIVFADVGVEQPVVAAWWR